MSKLTDLPNIGQTLADKLIDAGIRSHDELARIGSVKAVLRIASSDESGCYNMLFALEGAIRGVRWHNIPANDRTWLMENLDDARRETSRKHGMDDA